MSVAILTNILISIGGTEQLTWMASVSIVVVNPRNFAISAKSAKKKEVALAIVTINKIYAQIIDARLLEKITNCKNFGSKWSQAS